MPIETMSTTTVEHGGRAIGKVMSEHMRHGAPRFYAGDVVTDPAGSEHRVREQYENGIVVCGTAPNVVKYYSHQVKLVRRPLLNRLKAMVG